MQEKNIFRYLSYDELNENLLKDFREQLKGTKYKKTVLGFRGHGKNVKLYYVMIFIAKRKDGRLTTVNVVLELPNGNRFVNRGYFRMKLIKCPVEKVKRFSTAFLQVSMVKDLLVATYCGHNKSCVSKEDAEKAAAAFGIAFGNGWEKCFWNPGQTEIAECHLRNKHGFWLVADRRERQVLKLPEAEAVYLNDDEMDIIEAALKKSE